MPAHFAGHHQRADVLVRGCLLTERDGELVFAICLGAKCVHLARFGFTYATHLVEARLDPGVNCLPFGISIAATFCRKALFSALNTLAQRNSMT